MSKELLDNWLISRIIYPKKKSIVENKVTWFICTGDSSEDILPDPDREIKIRYMDASTKTWRLNFEQSYLEWYGRAGNIEAGCWSHEKNHPKIFAWTYYDSTTRQLSESPPF